MFGIKKAFQAATRLIIKALPDACPIDPARPYLNILVCQDDTRIQKSAKTLRKQSLRAGLNVDVQCVQSKQQLFERLDYLKDRGMLLPNVLLLDVIGMHESGVIDIITWFNKYSPGQPLPAIHFMSSAEWFSLKTASDTNELQDDINVGFVDAYELTYINRHLSKTTTAEISVPFSTTLRDLLNDRLQTQLPLERSTRNDDLISGVDQRNNTRAIELWKNGKISASKMLNQLRDYALGYAATLHGGVYSKADLSTIEKDAKFYSATGAPLKGPAVFSREDAEKSGNKPILIMQTYDPNVVPLLISGKIGGLVVTSTYMASHLKMICESLNIPGLFGLMQRGNEPLTASFNEEAKPLFAPYFTGDTVSIAGIKVSSGQTVLMGLDGSGMSFNPPESLKPQTTSNLADAKNPSLQTAIYNMGHISRAFSTYFEEQGLRPFGIKANVDMNFSEVRDYIQGIGLIRTEQIVAADAKQLDLLKKIILEDKASGCTDLQKEMARTYRWMITHLDGEFGDEENPVKIRLFDFTHDEILSKEEQRQFHERYKRMDIHGGAALQTWPELYQAQVDAIFTGYQRAKVSNKIPLEIMMPAVRTEQDVLDAKKLVDESAQRQGVAPERYSFGVMVETPEACENITRIAPHVDFISFGTNDLTQHYLGIPRNNAKAHAAYEAQHGYNPFKTLSPDVFALMKSTITRGRDVKPELKIDVCGAQAAELETALALRDAGVDNISVAPTLDNLHGLAAQINYRIFDTLQPPAPKLPQNGGPHG